jgi:hypothetical protein
LKKLFTSESKNVYATPAMTFIGGATCRCPVWKLGLSGPTGAGRIDGGVVESVGFGKSREGIIDMEDIWSNFVEG